MAYKRLLFGADARNKVLRGVEAMADAVAVTLGPKSKRVLIEKKWDAPLVCDDGVTIAKEVELKDPEENLGARMLRQVAERTGDSVGDGTTTSILLARAIYAEGVKNVVAGASAVDVKRGIDRGARAAVDALRLLSKPVVSQLEKAQVATISAHGDVKMGQLVAEAVERVGAEGAISVEESRTAETVLDVVSGLRFDRGYLSHYFVTDTERLQCVMENPLILLHEQKITHLAELVPFLETVVKTAQPVLIIAEDIESDALSTLVVNKVRGAIACCAVKAPGFGDGRREQLEDIAILTGARVITTQTGTKLQSAGLQDVGKARRVVIDKDNTTIVGGGGAAEAIRDRVAQLRKQAQECNSQYERDKLHQRIAKLAGGVAVIRVGAITETELKATKEAFDDAISSTRAAVAEGIVPGAGYALLKATDAVALEEANAVGDEKTGLRVLRMALEAPTRQIARNSELDSGVVVERTRAGSGIGLNAATGAYVDLIQEGIVDPTKVVRVALQNAVSVAGILLLTEATLTEVPEAARQSRGRDEDAGDV